ncbi:MAG TPA: SEC-C metal-binding domain-containing protein [Pirellulales bacterium]|jgi:preprotein translocase subunit SecA|nr:SEC-C metal-binding domain-containing protein [Pirellulales bacterium]
MEVLERIWEVIGGFFTALGSGLERGITSLFGSSNARFIKKLQPQVDAINALEAKFAALSDEELHGQTALFRKRLAAGETLDGLLVEAFAACRESGRRHLSMRHYDVQLMGGMILHGGNIAEMVTGEGKTLVATLPAYLNALAGRGVHVVTVNDYLARRDMEWMGPLYMGLGMTVGNIQSGMDSGERQKSYACDITYGTNNEFGFDYLRDNMRPAARDDERYPKHLQQAQGKLFFAIIDEVDNILIDEARTPLIIAGPAHDDVSRYSQADKIARQLQKDTHFEIKEKEHTVHLTDEGVRAAEKLAGVESFYTSGHMEWPHLIDNALKAHHLYKRDVNYVVMDGEIIIVDEFTGRLMPGRNWSDGLHQACEAKEGVKVKEENQTLATITLQNFFKLYEKICGMTGTAMTEASEFWKIYKLDVISVPTNRGLKRTNHPDVIYRTEREKFGAIADEIERLHRWDLVETKNEELVGTIVKSEGGSVEIQTKDKERKTVRESEVVRMQKRGRPVLVGTVSIEKSERLSGMLDKRGIKHEVLNAKHHKREAEIVAQAGRKNAVTIATNMAGRGTDIILGGNAETMAWALLQDKYATRLDVPQEEWTALVKEIEEREKMKPEGVEVRGLGGLHIIGTERHEARRIDLQLRGRCGRQGDPGSSRFYLSLEDDLMRIFAGEWVKNVWTRLGIQEGEAITSRMVSRRIEGAQKKVEERNFEVRKNLLEYDEVMDEQRKRVYGYRQRILDGAKCKTLILEMIDDQVDRYLGQFLAKDYGTDTFAEWASGQLAVELEPRDYRGVDFETASRQARDEAARLAESQVLDAIEENLPEEEDPREWNWEALAKTINTRWKLNVRDRDLKKIERSAIAESLIEQARATIEASNLSEGAKFLGEDFGVRTACNWVQYKFGATLDPAEMAKLEPQAFKDVVKQRAAEIYDERETEYPVVAGMYYFTTQDEKGQKRVDRDRLVAWARERFGVELDVADIRGRQRDEIQSLLVEHSRAQQQQANAVLVEAQERVEKLYSSAAATQTAGVVTGGNGALSSLSEWLKQSLHCELPPEKLARLDREELEQRVETAVEDRYRPEMRRMERSLLLQILDAAWKDHLLAMDHLRASVGLRGYAQVDPKVEYKREGMRTFELMWSSVAERVTDLVYRVEQLDDLTESTFNEGSAIHEEAPPATDIAGQQQAAIDGTQSDKKSEPIRNRGERVGRNDPCPCGSGKKFKNCCMRKHNG